MPITRVLFVCTGNICRSPTAEAVFLAKAAAVGLKVVADSAGTSDEERGNLPDRRSVAVAAARGYELPRRGARQVRRGDFTAFDLIVPMTRAHEHRLRHTAPPEATARIELLMSYAPATGVVDVPDPWYGALPDFEHALDLIEEGVDGLVVDLAKAGRPSR